MSTGHLQLLPPVPPVGYRELRRWVHSFLTHHPVADVDPDDVALVLIELARDAIRHAARPVDIQLDDDAGVLLARVSDPADERSAPRRIGHRSEGDGRPLVLLAGLSSGWGVDRLPGGGAIVWCEFAPAAHGSSSRPPAPTSRAASQR